MLTVVCSSDTLAVGADEIFLLLLSFTTSNCAPELSTVCFNNIPGVFSDREFGGDKLPFSSEWEVARLRLVRAGACGDPLPETVAMGDSASHCDSGERLPRGLADDR
jgi:hypothetical protein